MIYNVFKEQGNAFVYAGITFNDAIGNPDDKVMQLQTDGSCYALQNSSKSTGPIAKPADIIPRITVQTFVDGNKVLAQKG